MRNPLDSGRAEAAGVAVVDAPPTAGPGPVRGGAKRPRRGGASSHVRLAASTYVLRLSVTVIGAAIGVIIARDLGSYGRGEVAFAASLYYVALLVLNLGYENALLHRLSQRGAPQASLRRLGGAIAAVAGVAGVLGVVLLVRLLPGRTFFDVKLEWVVLGVGPLPFALDLIYLRALFQADRRLRLVNWTTLGGAAVQLAIVVAGVATHRLTVSVALAATGVGFLFSWSVLRLKARAYGRARLDGAQVRQSLAFGLKSTFGILFLELLYRFDFLVVKGILGTSALGRYSVSTSVAELLWLVTDSLALAMISRQVAGSFEEALDLTVRTVRKVLLLLPVAALGLAGFATVAIPAVFGPQFRGSVAPMLLLLPGVVAVGAVKPVTVLLIRSNRPGTLSMISLAGLAVNVAILFPLASAFGLVGAAVASAVAYSLIAAIYVAWLARQGVRPRDLVPGRADARELVRMLWPLRTAQAEAGR